MAIISRSEQLGNVNFPHSRDISIIITLEITKSSKPSMIKKNAGVGINHDERMTRAIARIDRITTPARRITVSSPRSDDTASFFSISPRDPRII